MTSQEQEQLQEMIQEMELTSREATILQLLADDMEEFDIEELGELVRNNIITVGFTIDQLDTLLDEFYDAREAEATGQRLIGWMFRFPKPSENTPEPLISNIRVNRMDLSVTNDGSTFAETPLLHGQGSNTQGRSITLTPKVFFQRKDVETDQMFVPYPPAFDATLPRARTLRTLPMSTLEGYFPWADLAMLQRSDLDNFVDYVMRKNTAYTDLFFSGANMVYATMHNPTMRLEQLNLMDSTTNPPSSISVEDSRRPFTIKVEPYIAALDVTKEWLRQGTTAQGAPPIGENDPGEDEGEPAEIAAVAALPMAARMYPCPTVWDIGNQIGLEAARVIGASDSAVPLAFQNQVMARLYDNPSRYTD